MPQIPSKTAQVHGDSAKTSEAPRPAPGRGKEDLVHRLRSAVWFGAVDNRYAGRSVNAMDVDLLGLSHAEARVMWRIKRYASDPGSKTPALLGGRSAVDIIGERSGFHHTRRIYESELFTKVLVPKPLGAEERDGLTAAVLHRLGLHELLESDRVLAAYCKKHVHAFRRPTRRDLEVWSEVFGRKREIDHVLLLCLLYQRALATANLEEAIVFRDAIRDSINRFCARPGFDGSAKILWQFITWRRVISGRTSLKHGEAALCRADQLVPDYLRNTSTSTAKNRYHQYRFMLACELEMHEDTHFTHIVKCTPEINRFLEERKSLDKRAGLAAIARSIRGMRRYLQEGVDAATRFREMHGHREPWRPGDC